MTKARRRARVWKVADFATHAGLSHRAARRLLMQLDAKHGGRLLHRSGGANRAYTFHPATLQRLAPDLFVPVESVEFRLEELEEAVATMTAQIRRIAAQVGDNTRRLAAAEKPRQRSS